jgi:hypothetical protein
VGQSADTVGKQGADAGQPGDQQRATLSLIWGQIHSPTVLVRAAAVSDRRVSVSTRPGDNPASSPTVATTRQKATPHEDDGFHFAIRIEKGGVEHERHFWVAACPAPAPAPPAPAAVPPRSGVSAAAAVPRTGADPHDLEGLMLVTVGSGCLGAASLMRRRRFTVAMPAGVVAGAPGRACGRQGLGAPAATTRRSWRRSVHRARTAAVSAVLAIGLLSAATTHLPHIVAKGVDQAWATSVGLVRTAATGAHQLVRPAPPPDRFVPVDASSGDPSESDLVEQELSDLAYAFPADTHGAVRRPGR